MPKQKSRKRRFNVPRGTGASVAKELGLARSHVTRVIAGDRPAGAKLTKRLEEIEMDAADRESERTAREQR